MNLSWLPWNVVRKWRYAAEEWEKTANLWQTAAEKWEAEAAKWHQLYDNQRTLIDRTQEPPRY